MRLGVQAFFKCRGDTRLADARLAGDQYDLAVARLGARPPAQQQVDLFVAANQRGQFRSVQCLEAAGYDTLTQHLPMAYWPGVAVRVECAEIVAIEQIADQTPGDGLDRHSARLRRHLQPDRQVWSVADNAVIPDLADRDEITHDDHSRRYADPAPYRRVDTKSQGPDRRTQFEPRADRLLGVMFVRGGVAEKDEDGIPEMAGDESVVARDDLRDTVLKGADRLVQILEANPVGSCRHTDRFARHGGDLPTFGCVMSREVRHLGERGLSADQFGHAVGEVGYRSGRDGNGQGRRNISSADVSPELADLAGELVASPGNRLDQVAVRSEGLAQTRNLALQPVFLDDPVRPDPAQQLVLADHSPWRLEQRQQQVECASAEPYRPAFGEQLTAIRQDAEAAKFDDRRRVRQANHDRQL
jgi:hypothetical protein